MAGPSSAVGRSSVSAATVTALVASAPAPVGEPGYDGEHGGHPGGGAERQVAQVGPAHQAWLGRPRLHSTIIWPTINLYWQGLSLAMHLHHVIPGTGLALEAAGRPVGGRAEAARPPDPAVQAQERQQALRTHAQIKPARWQVTGGRLQVARLQVARCQVPGGQVSGVRWPGVRWPGVR